MEQLTELNALFTYLERVQTCRKAVHRTSELDGVETVQRLPRVLG